MTLKLGIRRWLLRCYQICSNYDAGLTLTYFSTRSILVPFVFTRENSSAVDYQETTEACGEYRCTYSQINECTTIYDNPRSRSFKVNLNHFHDMVKFGS